MDTFVTTTLMCLAGFSALLGMMAAMFAAEDSNTRVMRALYTKWYAAMSALLLLDVLVLFTA